MQMPGICSPDARSGALRSLPFSVLDVNDENPTFFPAVYNVSLPENVARDFKVVRLNCTDADAGLNAELSYFITGMPTLQNAAKGSLIAERRRLPQTLAIHGVLHISSAFSSPSKPCTVSPSAEQPRLAPALQTAYALPGANPCPRHTLPSHLRDTARRSMRMGRIRWGARAGAAFTFMVGSLSRVLGYLIALHAGGFGWAGSKQACAAPAAGGWGTPWTCFDLQSAHVAFSPQEEGRNRSVTGVIFLTIAASHFISQPLQLPSREKRCVLSHRYRRPRAKLPQFASEVFRK